MRLEIFYLRAVLGPQGRIGLPLWEILWYRYKGWSCIRRIVRSVLIWLLRLCRSLSRLWMVLGHLEFVLVGVVPDWAVLAAVVPVVEVLVPVGVVLEVVPVVSDVIKLVLMVPNGILPELVPAVEQFVVVVPARGRGRALVFVTEGIFLLVWRPSHLKVVVKQTHSILSDRTAGS